MQFCLLQETGLLEVGEPKTGFQFTLSLFLKKLFAFSFLLFTDLFQVRGPHVLHSDVDGVTKQNGDGANDEPDAFEDEPGREDLPDHQMAPENISGEHRGKQSNALS